MSDECGVRWRRWSLALGTSLVAMGAAGASPASAQCSPDPAQANTVTTCTGIDEDGLEVTTSGTTVKVESSAIVRAGTADAAISVISVPSQLNVAGLVDGVDKPGIAVIAGPPYFVPCNPYSGASFSPCTPGTLQRIDPTADATIIVAEGATITGSNALLLSASIYNRTNSASARITNAGTLTGTTGPAIFNNLASSGSLTITNDTSGLIDGGANGAISIITPNTIIRNSGRIVSTGSASTIRTSGGLSVTNNAGAELGGGAVAISAGRALTLTNAGTINGSVISTAAAGENSIIDTRQGMINGDLTLGSGDDTLRALFDVATGRVSSITGTVDGGAGTDTILVDIDADATLSAPILPANFEVLGLELIDDAAVTLAPGFAGAISLGGNGSVTNQANLTVNGQAVTARASGSRMLFTNEANITSALTSDQVAVSISDDLINNGTITGNGGNGARSGRTLVNSGTITASGTAALSGDTLTNTGTISSTSGVGAQVTSNPFYVVSTNAGSISGATVGVVLSSATLANTGTITGGVTGVELSSSARLLNQASGIITGGTNGVLGTSSDSSVTNAGTINGQVNFVSAFEFDNSENIFVDAGGTVNGAILLGGADDQLVVDLVPPAGRALAGATGGVDGGDGYDILRYRVDADSAATLALPDTFEGLAYELDNNAALSLTADNPIVTTIGLTGNGTVTIDGAISTTDRTLVDTTIPTVEQLAGNGAGPAQDLTVINSGTLALVANSGFGYRALSAINAGMAKVTNNGTISVTNAADANFPAWGIFAGETVTNNGTISLAGGGIGIYSSGAVINTGLIEDTAGSNAIGISSFTSLDNSGTILVDGDAVQSGFYSQRITNSGIIESRQATGVTLGNYSVLTNEAGGTISGLTAIALDNGTVLNRGAITGDVNSSEFSSGRSVYIADGGTLAGDLRLGGGRDLFVMTGAESGVAGSIDGGEGEDVFARIFRASASVSLDGNPQIVSFEDALVQAVGSDTVATITASNPFAGNLSVEGTGSVVNTATIAGAVITDLFNFVPEVSPDNDFALASFDNQGTIGGGVRGSITSFDNSGIITAQNDAFSLRYAVDLSNEGVMRFDNSGQVDGIASLIAGSNLEAANSGTIATSTGLPALSLTRSGDAGAGAITLANSGTINASASDNPLFGRSVGLLISSKNVGVSASVTNTQSGTISAAGAGGIALQALDTVLTLDNAGIIGADTAILSIGMLGNTVRNTGTLAGAVLLGAGNDRVESSGTIGGTVFLGAGDDTFVHRGAATLGEIVNGGTGSDAFFADATADGSLDATQLTGFEQLTQIGTGTFSYSGQFEVDTIALAGGTLAVTAGQTLATTGAVTITGGETGVAVNNSGTIAGGITLGGAADSIVNTGAINAAVLLGGGDDSYTQGATSTVGSVDGGDGIDLYRIVLAGDRTGIGARSNFEQLAVDGTGMLALTLDQDFQSIALGGTSLTAALNGFMIDRIDGSGAAEQVALDGDVAAVFLNGGDDVLALGGATAAGQYDGGDGTDILRFTNPGPITLTGTVTAFETVLLAGNELFVSGTLSNANGTLTFGEGGQSLSVVEGGVLAGSIDLGEGDDSLRIGAGAVLTGHITGGAGNDSVILDLREALTLAGGLTGFEQLTDEGSGTLTLTGGRYAIERLALSGDLGIATDASLSTSRLNLGAAGSSVTIAGGFSGSIAGGAGNDLMAVSGGSAGLPIAFDTVSGIEALRVSAGLATIAGGAAFDTVTLTGGRLIGLEGSTITSSTINVGQEATFGSAGTVNANIAVSGTLSPGASPGTMVVNGNVALAGSSVSVFEITPSAIDRLVINGGLSIAQGATLQLVATQSVTPGQSVDLITASGGITGSYTNVVKPADLFGFIVQDAGRIALLGQFLNDTAFTPQVRRSIDYVNSVLVSGRGSPALLAAVPQLVDGSGASNQAAFAQLAPEAYASASQITIEQGIELAEMGRNQAFATRRSAPGFFAFANALANTRELEGTDQGAARAQTDGFGFLGGFGWGSADWSVGAFAGYLDSTQKLAARGARTEADGVVAGIHGRWASGGLDLKATIAYDGGDAITRRTLIDGAASGEYDLEGWISDVSVGYTMPLSADWTIRPGLGVTAIRATRESVTETGDSAFALDVARDRHQVVFADGSLTLAGGVRPEATLKPYLSVGLRYRIDGDAPYALAALDGGDYGFTALGTRRSPVTATAALGGQAALSERLNVFGSLGGEAGGANHHATARAGLRLAF